MVAKEVTLGWVLGPFKPDPFNGLICSPLNFMQKAGMPLGKYHLIHNLAYLYIPDQSMNSTIPDEQVSMAYAPLDCAVKICVDLGVNCSVEKMNDNSAFHRFTISGIDLVALGFTICRIFETFTFQQSIKSSGGRVTH